MVSVDYGYYYNPYKTNVANNNYSTGLLGSTYVNPFPVFNGDVSNVNAYTQPTQQTQTTQQTQPTQTEEPKKTTKDGKDDGKIGFWGATKNFFKGAWKFVTSPFTDENGKFSLWKSIKSVAIGVALVSVVGAPILLGAGAALGAIGMVKSGVKIAKADTDAEAEAAWQSMGASTTAVAASVAGMKSYAKGSATAQGLDASKYNGVRGTFRAVGKTYSDAGASIKAGVAAIKTGAQNFGNMTPAEIKASASAKYDAGKDWLTTKWNDGTQAVKNGYQSVKDGYTSIKNGGISDGIVSAYNNGLPAGATQATSLSEITLSNITKTVVGIARQKAGLGAPNGAGIWANTKAAANSAITTVRNNPAAVGAYTLVARQDIKPDFYDMLTAEEQAYFDQLSADDQEAIIEQYYAAM